MTAKRREPYAGRVPDEIAASCSNGFFRRSARGVSYGTRLAQTRTCRRFVVFAGTREVCRPAGPSTGSSGVLAGDPIKGSSFPERGPATRIPDLATPATTPAAEAQGRFRLADGDEPRISRPPTPGGTVTGRGSPSLVRELAREDASSTCRASSTSTVSRRRPRRFYGLDEKVTEGFGPKLLAASLAGLLEKGVRFIQLWHGGAFRLRRGSTGTPTRTIVENHRKANRRGLDKNRSAGLLTDLGRPWVDEGYAGSSWNHGSSAGTPVSRQGVRQAWPRPPPATPSTGLPWPGAGLKPGQVARRVRTEIGYKVVEKRGNHLRPCTPRIPSTEPRRWTVGQPALGCRCDSTSIVDDRWPEQVQGSSACKFVDGYLTSFSTTFVADLRPNSPWRTCPGLQARPPARKTGEGRAGGGQRPGFARQPIA